MDSVRWISRQAEREHFLTAYAREMQERRAEQDAELAVPARLPRAADGILVGVLLSIAVTLVVWGAFTAFAAAAELGM